MIPVMRCSDCGTRWVDDGGPGCPDCDHDAMTLWSLPEPLPPDVRPVRTLTTKNAHRERQAAMRAVRMEKAERLARLVRNA